MEQRGCREKPGAAGLQRVEYLKTSLGTLVQGPVVCDAGAASRSWRVRGPVCFAAPSLPATPGVCCAILHPGPGPGPGRMAAKR